MSVKWFDYNIKFPWTLTLDLNHFPISLKLLQPMLWIVFQFIWFQAILFNNKKKTFIWLNVSVIRSMVISFNENCKDIHTSSPILMCSQKTVSRVLIIFRRHNKKRPLCSYHWCCSFLLLLLMLIFYNDVIMGKYAYYYYYMRLANPSSKSDKIIRTEPNNEMKKTWPQRVSH